jgi:hypothetical protein
MKTGAAPQRDAADKRKATGMAARGVPKVPAPPAKPFVPKPGDVAPNGMRFR